MRREKISSVVKQNVIKEIESGRLSQGEAAKRLGVDKSAIRQWQSRYRSEGNAGLESDNKNRIYSIQTKQQAVEAYLTGQYSLQRICEIFKIRSTWTLKYKELGEVGLEDRRGKRKYEQEFRTELEQAQIEIAQLKHQLRMAEMENHLLKKLKEIERRETLSK